MDESTYEDRVNEISRKKLSANETLMENVHASASLYNSMLAKERGIGPLIQDILDAGFTRADILEEMKSGMSKKHIGPSLEEFLKEEGILEQTWRRAMIARAVDVIGDEHKALRWLATPLRALDYATPISRLNDEQGRADVLRILTQLEHGVL